MKAMTALFHQEVSLGGRRNTAPSIPCLLAGSIVFSIPIVSKLFCLTSFSREEHKRDLNDQKSNNDN